MSSSAESRLIELHHTHNEQNEPIFRNNAIKTTKYTVWNFLPLNLFEQLQRIANAYFVLVAVMLSLDGVPIPAGVAVIPLTLVLTISATREAIEQIAKSKSDTMLNNSKTKKLQGNQFVETIWSNLHPGDIIYIEKDQQIPADCVLLSTNEEGIAFIETANLDGETNLKVKQAIPATVPYNNAQLLSQLQAVLECDLPNNKLYVFNGSIEFDESKYSLEAKQLLLRGSVLKNTAFAIGAVVYTGSDSKLLQNANESRHKVTRLERGLNPKLVVIFVTMLTLALACAIRGTYLEIHYFPAVLFENARVRSNTKSFVMLFISHLVIINAMVPISLYVTLEVVRVFQAMFVNWDNNMEAKARTTTISDDLGLIEYVFSDKTGTLTRNEMEFMKCSVAGQSYGDGLTEIAVAAAKRTGRNLKTTRGRIELDTKNQMNRDFLWLLSVCHSVLVNNGEYEASSPDEAALVKAAADLGWKFVGRSNGNVIVEVEGKETEVEVLVSLEFSSERKRSSIIIRHPDTGKLVLFCKGADDLIYERLEQGSPYQQETKRHLEDFAGDGLRTLCCAYKELNEKEFSSWLERYNEATCAIDNREGKINVVCEEVERGMMLLGATAIEDKLQEGVPDAIDSLMRAGISTWIITGDKKETAINIGFSCSLLTSDMTLNVFDYEDGTLTQNNNVISSLDQVSITDNSSCKEALIITGSALTIFFENEANENVLFDIVRRAKAVICCRVSPLQKASLVKMVRNKTKKTTLAIGDGANDVGMILEADIGIGISGKEGRQAVLSSDYSISNFKDLKRLLLVHGRLNYIKNCELVNYCFYKNIVFTFNQIIFAFFCGFSANTLYNSVLYTIFNVVFTSAPPVIFATLEREVSQNSMMTVPELYKIDYSLLSLTRFFSILGLGLGHSLITFFVPYFAMKPFVSQNGYSLGLEEFGATVYLCVVTIVNIRIAVMCSYWTYLHHIFIWGSILVFPVTLLCLDMFKLSNGISGILSSNVFYLSVIATSILGVIPILYIRVWVNSRDTIVNRVLHFERKKKGGNLREEVAEFVEPERVIETVFVDTKNRTGYVFDEPESVEKAKYESRIWSNKEKAGEFRSVRLPNAQVSKFELTN